VAASWSLVPLEFCEFVLVDAGLIDVDRLSRMGSLQPWGCAELIEV
jgi:hypothetical protein